jgi:hypothetical protein
LCRSRSPPRPCVAVEHPVCAGRAPGPGRVFLGLAGRRPVVEDRVEDAPGLLDLLIGGEQARLVEQGVEDEPLIGLRRLLGERLRVGEVHVHVADVHRRARDLRPEAQQHTLIGLDPDDERVVALGLGLPGAERLVRGGLEDQRDLGDPPAEPLPGTQVERDARPAPRIDAERRRRVGLRPGIRVEPALLAEAGDELGALPAGGVLAARRRLGERAGGGGRLEDLELLRLQFVGGEGHRLLHRHEGEQLEQVVLHDVAGGADAVVVAGTAAEADVLGHGDLDVVDVARVEQRLEDLVGEAEDHDVLHGLLAQVVVDAEDRGLGEDRVDRPVQLLGGGLVTPEGLLDDHPPPAGVAVGQPGAFQLVAHVGEELRRNREVVGPVAARPAFLVELPGHRRQVVEGRVGDEITLHEPDPGGELLPHRVPPRRPDPVADRVEHLGGELLGGPVTAAVADETESGGQQTPVGEVVDRREELLARQVAGDAEDDESAGAGDAGETTVIAVAQRIAGGTHSRSPMVSSSSCQEATNLSTPSVSSTVKTSSRSMPAATRSAKTRPASSPVPLSVSPVTSAWSRVAVRVFSGIVLTVCGPTSPVT